MVKVPGCHGWSFAVIAAFLACTAAIAAPDIDETQAEPTTIDVGSVVDETAPEPQRWLVTDLLDPEHPREQREHLLDNLVLEADRGYPPAAMLLGHLYFLGPDHPSGLVERRLDLAERYFRTGLDAGDPDALTALAEVELARGNPGDALAWVQAHLIFLEHLAMSAPRGGYAVALLARAEEAGRGTIDPETELERVQAIMDSHAARVLAHDAANYPSRTTGMQWAPWVPEECRDIQGDNEGIPATRSMRLRLRKWVGGSAKYLVSLSPEGEMVDVLVVSSMPHALFGIDMAASVRANMAFNAVSEACHRRWFQLPVDSGDFQSRLR